MPLKNFFKGLSSLPVKTRAGYSLYFKPHKEFAQLMNQPLLTNNMAAFIFNFHVEYRLEFFNDEELEYLQFFSKTEKCRYKSNKE